MARQAHYRACGKVGIELSYQSCVILSYISLRPGLSYSGLYDLLSSVYLSSNCKATYNLLGRLAAKNLISIERKENRKFSITCTILGLSYVNEFNKQLKKANIL